MTTVVNLYGGPGAGKSTLAAFAFQWLKLRGKNAELVQEYVKSWAWEGRPIGAYDQLYFLGKQIRRESLLHGKVDYIVTDAPILLGTYYASAGAPRFISEGVRAAGLGYYNQAREDGIRHEHILLRRSGPYRQEGRYQDEYAARAIDDRIVEMLESLRFGYTVCDARPAQLEGLLEAIVDR